MTRIKAVLQFITRSTRSAFMGAKNVMSSAVNAVMNMGVHFGGLKLKTRYEVQCFDANGNLRWADGFCNLVVTTGLNKLLDATFKTGLTTPAWFVGLKLACAVAAGDTMASHAGWAESSAYSEANRQAFTPGSVAAGSVDNSASKAVFSINASATITGCFLTDSNTKGGTTGTLYGAGDFSASRSVLSGDTLTVQVTISVS
jgi:hypothetical protein